MKSQADGQLKAVLLTLLEELPSDMPILLLGTSSVPFSELDEESSLVFAHRNVYALPNLVLFYHYLFLSLGVIHALSLAKHTLHLHMTSFDVLV